jgi:hypothetical protein
VERLERFKLAELNSPDEYVRQACINKIVDTINHLIEQVNELEVYSRETREAFPEKFV